MKLALDIEGVIGDTHALTYERSNKLSRDVEGQEWGFGSDSDLHHFLDLSEQIWRDEYHVIPLMESNTVELISEMNDLYDVDVVTSRMGVDEQVEEFLNHHNIEYDELHIVDRTESKAQLEYDVYVDDKPALAEKVDRMFLYDHPYNRHVEEGNGIIRVDSLRDVIDAYPIVSRKV